MTLKAIPTEYKGVAMRSRLEGHVAEMLDRYNIAWEYEKQGYDLDGTWYLPDFYLPAQAAFLEVKPDIASITPQDMRKILLLAAHAHDEGKSVCVWTHPSPNKFGNFGGHMVHVEPVPLYIQTRALWWGLDSVPLESCVVWLSIDDDAFIKRCPRCKETWIEPSGTRYRCDNGCLKQARESGDVLFRYEMVSSSPLSGARALLTSGQPQLYYRWLDGKLTCLGDIFTRNMEDACGNARAGCFPSAYTGEMPYRWEH